MIWALSGAALEAAAFTLRKAAPDPEPFVVPERVLQAFGLHVTPRADALGLAGGTPLFRKERLRVGLRAQSPLLPLRRVPQQIRQDQSAAIHVFPPSRAPASPTQPPRQREDAVSPQQGDLH